MKTEDHNMKREIELCLLAVVHYYGPTSVEGTIKRLKSTKGFLSLRKFRSSLLYDILEYPRTERLFVLSKNDSPVCKLCLFCFSVCPVWFKFMNLKIC